MTNKGGLRKLFLYAGVEREEYNQLIPRIREENRMLLKVFSQLAAVMFFLLYIVSMLTRSFAADNAATYFRCAVEMLVLLFCTQYILPKHPALVMPLVYLFEILLFAFGIHVSMLHAERPAVSAVAFLLVSPLLFYDRPIRLSGVIAAVAAVFSAIAVRFKAPEVAESDVWNTITFGVVAVAATVFLMSIKIRTLAQARKIEYLSQTDLLTGVKNRNYYEKQLSAYPTLCTASLSCVYADVNGLHEMNNRNGHPAGDKMLREVAEALQELFEEEHIYRVGGDEFVAFRPDGRPEELPAEIERLRRVLSEKGYHVSFGTAVGHKARGELNTAEIVKEAEARMFADKWEFYRQREHDRRRR